MPSVTERWVLGRFVTTYFFLDDGYACSRLMCGLFEVVTGEVKYLFVIEQNDAHVIGCIFVRNCFEWYTWHT